MKKTLSYEELAKDFKKAKIHEIALQIRNGQIEEETFTKRKCGRNHPIIELVDSDKTNEEIEKEIPKSSDILFTKLYKKLKPSLKNYIRKNVKDIDVTEDLLSNTFTKIYTKIDTYDPKFAITTWSFIIAKRECLRWIKKVRNLRVSLTDLEINTGKEVTEDQDGIVILTNVCLEDINIKTENDYQEEEKNLVKYHEHAIDAIMEINEEYKNVLELNLLAGMKYKEITHSLCPEINELEEAYKKVKTEKMTFDELKSKFPVVEYEFNRIYDDLGFHVKIRQLFPFVENDLNKLITRTYKKDFNSGKITMIGKKPYIVASESKYNSSEFPDKDDLTTAQQENTDFKQIYEGIHYLPYSKKRIDENYLLEYGK